MKTLAMILCLVVILSCSSKNNTKRIQVVDKLEKLDSTSIPQKKSSFIPDTSINSISLNSDRNIESYLGNNIMDKNKFFTSKVILTKNHKQCLKLIFHPGGVKNEFSIFQVAYTSKIDTKSTEIIQVDDTTFKTEAGITLNMTLAQLKSLKGKPDSIELKNDSLICQYQIRDFQKSEFLRRYNMPIYHADYIFIKEKLIAFEFGFDYP